MFLFDSFLGKGIEQEIGHIVSQRAANEKLHREIVDTLGVLAGVNVLSLYPSLRQDIPHGTCDSLKTLTRAGSLQIDDIVEHKVAFIQRVLRPRQLNQAASILIAKSRNTVGFG